MKVALMTLLLGVAFPAVAWDQGRRIAEYQRTGRFAADRVRESSGVAVRRIQTGTLWTHNDSGDDPVLYLTDLRGRDLGWRRIAGARAVDWEDIAAGPCPHALTLRCVYVGDTGNNLGQREWVDIYVILESEHAQSDGDTVPVLDQLSVRLPSGPKDTEALGVDENATLWLIPKGAAGTPEVYRIDRSAYVRDTVTAQSAGRLAFGMAALVGRVPTGAGILPDGSRLVVRTYTELHFYKRDGSGAWSPDGEPCWLGLADGQGEGVDFLNDSTVVLTAEGLGPGRGAIGTAFCHGS